MSWLVGDAWIDTHSGFLGRCVVQENEIINRVCRSMCMSLDCVTSDKGDPKHVTPPFPVEISSSESEK